jgi:hypothetical protein
MEFPTKVGKHLKEVKHQDNYGFIWSLWHDVFVVNAWRTKANQMFFL